MYFVHVGRVKIVKSAGGRDVILEILGPGEPVGAVAVFERRPFPASAITLEPSSILSIPEREFFTLLESRPEMMRLVLAGLTYRLMMVNKRLADMTGSAEYRAARLFLTLSDRVGLTVEGGVRIPLQLSRQEIADLIGTTLETAIRLMSEIMKSKMKERSYPELEKISSSANDLLGKMNTIIWTMKSSKKIPVTWKKRLRLIKCPNLAQPRANAIAPARPSNAP